MRLSRLARSVVPLGALVLLSGAFPDPAQAGPLTPFPPGGMYLGETMRYRNNGFFDVFLELPEWHYGGVIEGPGPGPDDVMYTLDVFLTATVCVTGLGCGPGTANTQPGDPARVLALGQPDGTFDTEMLSMDLTGGSPFGPALIRESPTRPSTGISSLTGGGFAIDSFFDIFTELSLDGGQTWLPSMSDDMQNEASDRFTLREAEVPGIPEPATLTLVGTGIAAMVRRRTRRN